jgi:hypothetical protein
MYRFAAGLSLRNGPTIRTPIRDGAKCKYEWMHLFLHDVSESNSRWHIVSVFPQGSNTARLGRHRVNDDRTFSDMKPGRVGGSQVMIAWHEVALSRII